MLLGFVLTLRYDYFIIMKIDIFLGLEDFENKIDNIASGVDNNPDSWINKIYSEFNGALEDNGEDFSEVDGLEPPMLDETWGLKDDQEGIKRTPRKNIIDEDFEKHVEGILFCFKDTKFQRLKSLFFTI